MGRKFELNALFTDHMVLQRDRVVSIWGTGIEGNTVSVQCSGGKSEAVIKDGQWKIELLTGPAGGPHELIAESGGETIHLRDILFGDVWLAGGQSNMQWELEISKDGKKAVESAVLPQLRYYEVPRVAYEDGVSHASSWVECTPEQAGRFSAVGYYFAKDLIQNLDVPVGIIGCNWGGTSASCWVPEEVLTADPELKGYIDEYNQVVVGKDEETFASECRIYDEGVAEFNRKQALGYTGEDLGFHPWPPPMSPHSFLRPCGLYGTMIRKAVPYTLKGFIYYQGESDAHKPLLYNRLLKSLIEKWRTDWGNSELPFLFVQLTSFGCDGNPDGEEWPLLRESQLIVSETVPHTGMAVILDCGDLLDIHPLDKQTVGERLALLALNSVYGIEVESSGPVVREMQISSLSDLASESSFPAVADPGRALLLFDHVGSGLSVEGDELTGFEIAGEDGQYFKAHAALHDGGVELWSEEVIRPTAVRYAWKNYTEANLYNSFGLPAGPFRSLRAGRE